MCSATLLQVDIGACEGVLFIANKWTMSSLGVLTCASSLTAVYLGHGLEHFTR